MATPAPDSSLADRLTSVLPKGYEFGIYHLGTPPTKTDALCSAPPGEREDKTFCESHFLALTVDSHSHHPSTSSEQGAHGSNGESSDAPSSRPKGSSVLALAIEIFIYTTAYSTIVFVSKADSTGYLSLLGLPKGSPSPIKDVCGTFIGYLIEKRRRKGIQAVVSLFARAQDQYLFPGSVENKSKHVLDDRGLVKWWCRVLDPLLREVESDWKGAKGYLIVPGLDDYDTRAFLPRTVGSDARWVLGDPLSRISHFTREYDWVPPRCLIPRYPDDPKSRFRDELDEEVEQSKLLQTTGMWRSVQSVDRFWEMMAFRQECSSGRLTGFIWVVFDPNTSQGDSAAAQPEPDSGSAAPAAPATPPRTGRSAGATPLSTPKKLFISSLAPAEKTSKAKSKKKKPLRGPIKPRQPRIKTRQRDYVFDRPTSTAYYYWPPAGRGQKIMDESDYKRSIELLLHLDFSNVGMARGSTERWATEVGMGHDWVLNVTGSKEVPPPKIDSAGAGLSVNNISGLVKRKRQPSGGEGEPTTFGQANVLDSGVVRKKVKQLETVDLPSPPVNTLNASLVRKKPKPE